MPLEDAWRIIAAGKLLTSGVLDPHDQFHRIADPSVDQRANGAIGCQR